MTCRSTHHACDCVLARLAKQERIVQAARAVDRAWLLGEPEELSLAHHALANAIEAMDKAKT